MVVTSRCFAFRALITQAEKVNARQVYFIYPFLRLLKLGKSLQTSCVNFFFAQAEILSEKIRILESIFRQNKNRLRVQDLVYKAGKNFSTNQCHDKRFLRFSPGNVIL